MQEQNMKTFLSLRDHKVFSDLFHYAPPYITRYTTSPLEKINVCGSFIFIQESLLLDNLSCYSVNQLMSS